MGINKPREVKARMQQKIDTFENWSIASANDFIPLNGEIIIYTTDSSGRKSLGIKIGDGVTRVGELDFIQTGADCWTDADKEEFTKELQQYFAPASYIDAFHEYTNLSNVELDKMLLTIICNMETYSQDRCIISVNEDGLALDRGYWFFETTRRKREFQMQGRLGAKTAYRTFSDSRLYNGFFEIKQDIPGWTITDHSMTCVSPDIAHSGKYSVKFIDNRTDAGGQLYSDVISVEEGKEYTASAYVRGVSGGEIVQVGIWFLNESGEKIGANATTKSVSNDSWSLITYTATAPAGAVKAQVILATTKATTGAVYFDDVGFCDSTGVSILSNGDFEAKVAIPGWNIASGVEKNVSLSRDYVGDSNGRGVLKIVDNNPSGGVQVWSVMIPVTAGTKYKASVIVCGGDVPPLTQFVLRFFDSATASKHLSQEVATKQTATDVWNDVSVEGVAPDGATYAYVLLCTTGATIGTAYFDNVTLTAEGDPKPGFSDWVVVDMANNGGGSSDGSNGPRLSFDSGIIHTNLYSPPIKCKVYDVTMSKGTYIETLVIDGLVLSTAEEYTPINIPGKECSLYCEGRPEHYFTANAGEIVHVVGYG